MKKEYIQSAMCIVRMRQNVICTSPGGQESVQMLLYGSSEDQITDVSEVW